ncbi:MAG TPA: 3-hydroxyacyl-CoA dehydrogenase family protein [Paracoccus sp. (in: a-proteobacteria)]|uniref:3-hydroxyacyl-CoA dehydrogenase family protein n=1 Tax=uncultured Paracoccus sp. TaxID=189685 RepID=UPI0026289261|nr:3-hydroxyacyl-CoA dehydrogenase family protein [uncultured Paracoccus sp.]HMQ40059.1 3-hydroxyacyl-CoA dehydrogenase family protein [Paracoccus sp. (in: a-proteobacteria)]HMR35307.1 3-hydroxyacyl-CoA dehydrogenase family protein [Paracoccus sp. (in: a-proteobacteria)]
MRKNLQIAVIGAGLMGHGIALTLARAGQYVAVTDPSPEARAALAARVSESLSLMGESEAQIAKILKKIEIVDTIESAVKGAYAVFEAAPEKMALKQSIFAEIEAHAPDDCILASNTSVMPITEIMSGLRLKNRALGTHWWNPPHMIPLVEVIRTEWTEEGVVQAMMDLLADAGKTPVRVEKDVPGFIGNRLQHALWREAISLVERGICDAESVDTVVKSCFGRRLSVLGPLENADLVGTDLTLDIHNTVLADLEDRAGPSPYLERLVAEGKLGMKTGEGFRKWTPEDAAATRNRVTTHLRKLEGILKD